MRMDGACRTDARPQGYRASMLAKPIVFAFLAACGIGSGAAANPNEKAPPEDDIEDGQHFCCTSVDQKNLSGDGCGAISKENINGCDKMLYCHESWTKDDGKVVCG
jgi:hypothetical protein